MDTKIQKLLQTEKRKWLFLVGLVALTHLLCQSLMLPYGNALLSLLPNDKDHTLFAIKAVESSNNYSLENPGIGVTNLSSTAHSFNGYFDVKKKGKLEKLISLSDDDDVDDGDDDFDFIEDEAALGDDEKIDNLLEDGIITQKDVRKELGSASFGSNDSTKGFSVSAEETVTENRSVSFPSVVRKVQYEDPSFDNGGNKESHMSTRTSSDSSKNVSSAVDKHGKKKMKSEMPPKTVTPIEEMEKILVRHRARSRATRPRWSSERDQEILRARTMIEDAPIPKDERELYARAFRNVSAFKRSYELMERMLKIYVYKEGEKPIFHQPILKGLYASEGWFMKLMEGNKRFLVKDPRKAHLFYMPFSSRMLEHTLYVRNSHNRTNLRQHLRDYSEKIAAKYRFWNRTGGADHFLVACHDWAPYETRHHMEHCIKALCNADVTVGFKIGRDVSLPETYVRSARNPLRDLGGKPPSQRHILAFYAGNNHGYLRPILLEHWKDKHSDMKILGAMPSGVASKMSYISYMKSSKYCICPKGYEVNSPRVVEAIFYECVPVVISDNFVPPFFEVLNWEAFSVIVAEKDVPNLRKILLNISEEKYLEMQLGVRSVQRHFLWHAKPLKYDLFHMTLHSIWYNRVFQLKTR